LIELGPGAGEHGGYIVAQGTVEEFLKSPAVTAEYLSGRREIEIPATRRAPRTPEPTFDAPAEEKPKKAPRAKPKPKVKVEA
jgi:excinuclease UvrABC ATPase subunit